MKRHFGSFSVLCAAGILFLGSPSLAQKLDVEWTGAGAEFSSYLPQNIRLEAVKPAGIGPLPQGLVRPLFGQVLVGPAESRRPFTILVDERSEGEQRLYVDSNANGDFGDDPAPKWEPVTRPGARTSHTGTAKLFVRYESGLRVLELAIYRQRAVKPGEATAPLYCYRKWGYRGQAVLGGKTLKAAIDDFLTTGDFRGSETGKDSGVFLLLDVNGDGRFDNTGERFDVRKPFNIGGTTYEMSGLSADGDGMVLVPSNRSAAETKPNPVLTVGGPAPRFVARTTDGQPLRFPDDFRGRVVLLDFWATWCKPCRDELPNLKRVYDDLHSRGFAVVGVSLDKKYSGERLEKYTRENNLTWPQIFDGEEWEGEIARMYNVTGIPAAFLVDGDTGQIVAKEGYLRGSQLRPAVEKALGPGVRAGAGPRPAPESTLAMSFSQPREAPPARTPASTIVWSNPRPTAARPAADAADPLLSRAEEASRAGSLMSASDLLERRKNPAFAPLRLLAPSTAVLTGRSVARRAREGYLRVGWYYRCSSCNKGHLKLGGGYAVTETAVVTAWHVMTPPATSTSSQAVAFDGNGTVVSIKGVIAASERMDTIVLGVSGGALRPLPLSPAAEIGDAAFCFSDPLKQRNYFSAGIVNRYHVAGDDGWRDPERADPADLRMNVSTDWGPGSSGAAVLDGAGNVIGHVATIRPLFDEKPRASQDPAHGEEKSGPLMTLHDAIPARSILTLLRR
ncbi:MAG: redoxin domain-containing protein [Acidobacteria bacterium]|nr:redoxin domain-containing protein [Acidobacteriota bacterium]